MEILPADLSGLHIELTSDPRLLPWYYAEGEVDRLAWLLRLTLKGIDGELRLDDATLRVLSDRKVTAPTSLVVAIVRERSPDFYEIAERVRALGAGCALLQFPEPQEMGYGWVERQVKAPLYRAIGAWVKQPEHLLAAFNVQALPVMEAAALTTDPVELIELLERTVMHRLRYASVGVEDVDYVRSLYLSAGARLAARLQRLDSDALRAALEVTLDQEKKPGSRERFRTGAVALERAGLGRLVAGDFALGPLARSAREPRMLGALEASLPAEAFTDTALASVAAIRRTQKPPATWTPSVALAGAGSAELPVLDKEALDAIARTFPDEPAAIDALRLLREVTDAPMRELPERMRERTTVALRWLEVAEQSSSTERQVVARGMRLLLLLFLARGPDVLEQQAKILPPLEEALGEDPQVMTLVKLHRAWSLLLHRRSSDDASSAESLAHDSIELCKRLKLPSEHIAAVRMASAYLALAIVATTRAAYPAAREWAEKALDATRAVDHRALLSRATETLAVIAREEGRTAESERYARETLSLYEQLGDEYGIGGALRVLAGGLMAPGLEGRQEKIAEAKQLWERALDLAKRLDDKEGKAESMLGMSVVHLFALEASLAEPLARKALVLYEELGSTMGRADAYFGLGAILLLRLAIDEALSTLTRARELYETLGWQARVEAVKSALGQVSLLSKQPLTAALLALRVT